VERGTEHRALQTGRRKKRNSESAALKEGHKDCALQIDRRNIQKSVKNNESKKIIFRLPMSAATHTPHAEKQECNEEHQMEKHAKKKKQERNKSMTWKHVQKRKKEGHQMEKRK
jgi:seryl-tRNA synthetase